MDDDGAGMPVHLVNGVSFAEVALTTYHDSVFRHGRHHRQRYVAGVPEAPLEDVGATDRSGTRVTFVPDPSIFPHGIAMSFELVDERLREIALLNAGARVTYATTGTR